MPELDSWSTDDSQSFLVSEKSVGAMAKDTRVTFDSEPSGPPPKSAGKSRRTTTERQISYEDAENCVNEMSESFPALSNKAHRIMRQVSGSFNSKTIKVCLILSIILNLLLGIPFGVFLGMWLTQKNDLPSSSPSSLSHSQSSSSSSSSSSSAASQLSSSSSSSSLPSSSAITGSFGKIVIMESCFACANMDANFPSIKIRSRNNICCTDVKSPASDGSGYFFLSDEYLKRKINEMLDDCRHHKGHVPGSSARDSNTADHLALPSSAAHMYLDLEKTKSNARQRQGSSLAWKTTDKNNLSFVRSGLLYENGQIIIQKAGTYHVYSHMTLSKGASDSDTKQNGNTIVVHSIAKRYKRYRRGSQDENLLVATITVNAGEIKTSSLEGSFVLEEGDRLSVYVSFPSYLTETATGNVFGLFKL